MIGIVIPTFQRGPEQTIDNLTRQTRDDWRAIIVNQSMAWAQTPHHVSDTVALKIVEICLQIPGANMARNIGMSVAMDFGCDRICFWDDDDVFDADYLEAMSGALDDNPSFHLSACITRHLGKELPHENTSVSSRMIRTDAIMGRRWDNKGKLGQDRRWWAQFACYPHAYVMRSLYETGSAKVGGYRHEKACT